MKKIIAVTLLIVIHQLLIAQNYRDNIAVIINSTCFGCDLSQELENVSRSSYYAYFTTELEKNELFRIVNRDITNESVVALGKSFTEEDPGFVYWINYTEKMKEQSKGIGATHLILIDIFKFTDKKIRTGELYFRFKIINVETNVMETFTIKRDEEFKTEAQFREDLRELFKSVSFEMMDKIDEVWNTSFFIKSAEGKNLTIQPYSVFPLNAFQRINWFEWKQHDVGGQSFYEVLNLGDSKIIKWENGSIFIKTEMDFSKHDLQRVWGNIKPNFGLSNYGSFHVSFVELPLNTSDGIINFKINNSIYEAIKTTKQYSLVQLSSKDMVYAEKLIQRGDEFIDGTTIEQYNSRKGDYLLIAKNLGSSDEEYKTKIDFIKISTGEILKTKIIEASPSNFSKELSDWLFALLMPPCKVEVLGREINVFTNVRTFVKDYYKYQIIEMREVKLGSKTENIRVPLAVLKLKGQYGQKIVFEIDEILDEGYKKININNTYYLGINN